MAAPGTPSKGLATSSSNDTTVPSTSARPHDASDLVNSDGVNSSSEPSQPPAAVPPPPPPLHAAAQQGDIALIHRLLSDNEATPQDRDAQNCTALHWAAINNHVLACKELLNAGAEVDAVGGDLLATPIQWAARCVLALLCLR